MSLGLELGADGAVVLDDPVVNETNTPAGIGVRMGVGFGRRSMGSPAGVGDADDTAGLSFVGPFGPDLVGQTGDLAHSPQGEELAAVL